MEISFPPPNSIHRPEPNYNPEKSLSEIKTHNNYLSTIEKASLADPTQTKIPQPSSFLNDLAKPGKELEITPLQQNSDNGLSNASGAILYFIIVTIQKLQQEINSTMSVAGANLSIQQNTMEISAANNAYRAGMERANATKAEANIQMIMATVSIVVGTLSLCASMYSGYSAATKAATPPPAPELGATATNTTLQAAPAATTNTATASTTAAAGAGAGGSAAASSVASSSSQAVSGVATEAAKEGTQEVVKASAKGAADAVEKLGAGAADAGAKVGEEVAKKAFWATFKKALPKMMERLADPQTGVSALSQLSTGIAQAETAKQTKEIVATHKIDEAAAQLRSDIEKAAASFFANARQETSKSGEDAKQVKDAVLRLLDAIQQAIMSAMRG